MAGRRNRGRFGDFGWQQFPPSRPIPVEDGIATSKKRGQMADTWWSQHFVAVLESYGLGGRMERGRRYARAGQVVDLDVAAGLISASVQGSRPKPYVVTVGFPELVDEQWSVVEAALTSQIGLVAALAAGEVPPGLVDVFDAADVALMPARWTDLRPACSCPDGAVPCKHIAAVLYVFADLLDGDPWLLLAWRGRTRDEVFGLLRGGRGEADEVVEVAPWWPFAAGPIPDGALGGAGTLRAETGSLGSGSTALQRLSPLGIDVRGQALEDLIGPAYQVFVSSFE